MSFLRPIIVIIYYVYFCQMETTFSLVWLKQIIEFFDKNNSELLSSFLNRNLFFKVWFYQILKLIFDNMRHLLRVSTNLNKCWSKQQLLRISISLFLRLSKKNMRNVVLQSLMTRMIMSPQHFTFVWKQKTKFVTEWCIILH